MADFVLVPREPTEEMRLAGLEPIEEGVRSIADHEHSASVDWDAPVHTWNAMVAAAPYPWQPIETAPKDGTWVLLTGGDPYWDEDTGNRPQAVVGAWVPFPKPWDQEDGDWKFAVWDGALRSCYEKPTHWMLLPSPPVE